MGVSQVVSVPYALAASSLKEGATITGANGSQYTLTVGANGPVWSLTNPNVNFSCGQSVTYAGESYPTIQIGTQCWFQKNLNVGTMILGANDQTNNSISEKYCYNNLPANCDTFGGLYQWAEAVHYQNSASNTTSLNPAFSGNVKGICPTGWHIPDLIEWENLIDYYGGDTTAGEFLKSASNFWQNGNTSTNNGFFYAEPGGNRRLDGVFSAISLASVFHSKFEISNIASRSYGLYYLNNSVARIGLSKSYGYSIRCLKD
jgi:uncharacterized protein (TIGR02145 family)